MAVVSPQPTKPKGRLLNFAVWTLLFSFCLILTWKRLLWGWSQPFPPTPHGKYRYL